MRLLRLVLLALAALLLAAAAARAQCNAPPLPRAGETVTWPRAGGPYRVCGDLTIPAGGHVDAEPGVQVDFAPDARLFVEGALVARGTPAAPISFTAASVYPPMLTVSGSLDLAHGRSTGQIRPDSGGTLLFADCVFSGNGTVFAPDGWYRWVPPFLRFDRCRFEGASAALSVHHCTLVLAGCDFTGGASPATSYSYPWIGGVSVAGAPGNGVSLTHDDQPLYVDGVTSRDNAAAGIALSGAQAGNSFHLGPNNVLEGNAWPIVLGDGGLLPGSVVPSTGNVENVVLIDPLPDPRGPMRLPRLSVPYVVRGPIELGHGLSIDPGVEIRLAAGASLLCRGGNLHARGREGLPIRFIPDVPGQEWGHVGAASGDSKFEHCEVIGSANGIASPGTIVHVESCVLQGNGWGVQSSGYNPIRVRGSRFFDNRIGAVTDLVPNSPGFLDLDGSTNPNTFLGNDVAVQGGDGTEDATDDWWGPTGPRAPTNPGGTGDVIGPEVLYVPFRTTAPDFADSPPFVTLSDVHFLAEPGTRQVLRWNVEDDGAVASQRVVLSRAGEYAFDVVIAGGLPPDQRELAWTVPEIGYQTTCLPAYVRVVAVDDAGQEGWDQAEISIRSDDWIATVRLTSAPTGTHRPGEVVDACFETDAPAPWSLGLPEGFLFLDGDRWVIPLGGPATSTGCLPGGITLPFVSTDAARIGVRVAEGCNRFAWGFSDCFAIRPDPRIPDAPPVLTVTSPRDGDSVAAGSTLPVRWTASDDEALRSFDVLGSYDFGRTWHEIAVDLPADATGFDWTLPAGETFPGLRVRVIARDLRFQESGGCGVALSVVGDCLLDADGDGATACDDCAPDDATAWAPPGEDRMLLATSKTTFTWLPPDAPGGTTLLHDVLRTRVPSDFRSAAACLGPPTSATAFGDAEMPGLPGLFCYLVRARNGCTGTQGGTIGRNSFRVERLGRACP